jgi:predicted site-specific integrase-resolvase
MQDLLTTAELAQRLGVSPSAISRRVAKGELKPAAKGPGKRGAFFFAPEPVEAQE